jgi:hypothetical protein
MQQFVYKRQLDVLSAFYLLVAAVSEVPLSIRLAWLWLLHRHDRSTHDLVTCFEYDRYFNDPEISALIDEYLDDLREALYNMVEDDDSAKEARLSQMDETGERIKWVIVQRVWDEFPKRWRDRPSDHRWVQDLAERRCSELDNRMF